ncbi:methyl-CpG-binding domain protein 6 [Protopterus annectens]|uniref:methyl-CpG-binding domain protein 6 n=1 Tax=Protopterus annectens TaxID=7888 RepID=UPI001CF98C5A|nr:methyl-CpG-binding domain protein 6 [Protopterus annectens]
MTGGNESEGADNDDGTTVLQLPVGWQRKLEANTVVYVSPSGTILSSLEQVSAYLLADGTCKCGLECPLIVHKVFNFDPAAVVKPRSAEEIKADEDMTKLCNHRRKNVAMAALYKTMETSVHGIPKHVLGGTSNLTSPADTVCSVNRPQSLLFTRPSPLEKDYFSKFMMDKAVSLARPIQEDLSSDQKQHHSFSFPRERRSSFSPGQKSSFSRHRASFVEGAFPTANTEVLSKRNHDTCLKIDSVYSQELCTFPFQQNKNLPLSSQIHSTYALNNQVASQLSPKSSVNEASYRSVPSNNFFSSILKTSDSNSNMNQLAPLNYETNPLGMLDTIRSRSSVQTTPYFNTSTMQSPSPSSNAFAPSPLTSASANLLSPLVKAGHELYGNVLPRNNTLGSPSTTLSSMSSPGGSSEMSPQRSRHSSASSEQSGYLSGGHLSAACTFKSSSKSPLSLGSPKPSVPPSPKAVLEGLIHQCKDSPNSLLATNNALSHQSNNTPPAFLGGMNEKKKTGLLGMPLSPVLSQHNAACFPASKLLSAAAKAQLANQNKLEGGGSDGSSNMDITSTLHKTFSLNSNALLSVVNSQSGKTFTEKLSAKQKEHSKRRRRRHAPHVLSILRESQVSSSQHEECLQGETSAGDTERLLQQQPQMKTAQHSQYMSVVSGKLPPLDSCSVKLEDDPLGTKRVNPSLTTNQSLSSLLNLFQPPSLPLSGNTGSHTAGCASLPVLPHSSYSSDGTGVISDKFNNSATPSLPVTDILPASSSEAITSVNASTNVTPSLQDFNSQVLGSVGQLSSSPSEQTSGITSHLRVPVSTPTLVPNNSCSVQTCSGKGSSIQAAQTTSSTSPRSSPVVSVATTASGNFSSNLPSGDSFPFLSQDHLLSLGNSLPTSTGLLNPNLSASLPLLLAMNQQQMLNHSLLSLLSATLPGQNDGAINPPGFPTPSVNSAMQPNFSDMDGQTMQNLLMASLLQSPSVNPMLALSGLGLANLDLLQQQPSSLLSSLFPIPGLQDPLSVCQSTGGEKTDAVAPQTPCSAIPGLSGADVNLQSLLFPMLSIPPALMGLNPTLLANVLGSLDAGASQPQTCSTPSSVGSTSSTSTTGTTAASAAETPAPLNNTSASLNSGKLGASASHLTNPLLGTGVLSETMALNTNTSSTYLEGLQSLLGTNPLFLQNQQPLLPGLQGPLGLQLFQGQTPFPGQLNNADPLACLFHNLQLNLGTAISISDKPVTTSELHENANHTPSHSPLVGGQQTEHAYRHNTAGRSDSFSDVSCTSASDFTSDRTQDPACSPQEDIHQPGHSVCATATGALFCSLSSPAGASYGRHSTSPAEQSCSQQTNISPKYTKELKSSKLSEGGPDMQLCSSRNSHRMVGDSALLTVGQCVESSLNLNEQPELILNLRTEHEAPLKCLPSAMSAKMETAKNQGDSYLHVNGRVVDQSSKEASGLQTNALLSSNVSWLPLDHWSPPQRRNGEVTAMNTKSSSLDFDSPRNTLESFRPQTLPTESRVSGMSESEESLLLSQKPVGCQSQQKIGEGKAMPERISAPVRGRKRRRRLVTHLPRCKNKKSR